MKFIIYPRREIETVKPHEERHLIISIRTPGDPKEAKLPINERTMGVLRLLFDDIPDVPEGVEEELVKQQRDLGGRDLLFFDKVMAREIFDFVRPHKETVGTIIVHCDAGVSRSPAVAAGIAKMVFEQNDMVFFDEYYPNSRVYRILTADET